MTEAYIGVDVGTLSARAGVFDRPGRLIASARRAIAIWREPGEIVEQSSDDIWRAVTSVVREAVEASGLPTEAVRGMGFDATCSLVTLDGDGRPLSASLSGAPERDVIVWMDHRAVEDADRINAGGHEALRYMGGKISPEMHAPKLAWLARRKPEAIAKAGHFFDLTDFLSFRATGSLERSACPATCKFAYLAHEKRWPDEFFDGIGLGFLKDDHYKRIGAKPAAPGAPLGRGLTADVAAAMGLRAGTPVGAGLIDAHAGAAGTLGANVAGVQADPRRRLALILGTSSSCMALSDEACFVDGVWGPHFAALTPNQWLVDGGQSAFGAAIDHLLRLHPAFGELSARVGANALIALEKDVVARAGGLSNAALIAGGLHVLPDFIGSRSPSADAGARGGVMGMDLREDAASLQELYVACLCGLAYGVADIVRKLEQAGYDFEFDRRQRRRGAQRIGSSDHGRCLRQDGRGAGDAGAGAAGLGDDRRRGGGRPDHRFRDVVDVDDRAYHGAGERGGRGVPHAKAPSLRDPTAGRAGDSWDDARGALARSRDFRLRRRAGRQRGDRARRDPP